MPAAGARGTGRPGNFGVMRALSAMLVLALASAANAQMPMIGPTCMTGPAPTPPDLAAWNIPVPLGVARNMAGLDQANLTIGRRADLSLVPSADVRFAAPPTKPATAMSNGGMVVLTIAQAGTYRIALGSSVQIDLLRGSKRMAPTARGAGPDCSDLRQTIDFALAPGRYVLQVASNAQTTLALLVVKR